MQSEVAACCFRGRPLTSSPRGCLGCEWEVHHLVCDLTHSATECVSGTPRGPACRSACPLCLSVCLSVSLSLSLSLSVCLETSLTDNKEEGKI